MMLLIWSMCFPPLTGPDNNAHLTYRARRWCPCGFPPTSLTLVPMLLSPYIHGLIILPTMQKQA